MANSKLVRLKNKALNLLGRKEFGKRLFGSFGPRGGKRWAFILGCYNSGTTLLDRVIRTHPEITGMPGEGVAFTDVLMRPEELGWTRMWWKCRDEMRERSDYSVKGAIRLKRQWSWMLENRRAEVVLEKSIANVLHARFLDEHFDRPKFIHLVRNGYAVSEGIRRKARPGRWHNELYPERYPIELCARQWMETLAEVELLKGAGLDILEVRYEEFVRDPDAVLARVFGHIGVTPLQLGAGRQEWLVHGRKEKILDMNPASIGALSPEDRATIENTAASWLARLGYGAA